MSALTPKPFGLDKIYLDHNATTPVDPAVVSHLSEWLVSWGNPSSIHWAGRGPKEMLREARKKVASLINSSPLEVIFTSGGSEANNLAIKGVFEAIQTGRSLTTESRNQYIFSAVEHPSVAKTMAYLKSKGAQVDCVRVNPRGELDIDHFQSLLGEQTALVSIMYANNETGTIFPIKKLAALTHSVGGLFHCDAVQALGKAAVDVRKWDVDFASFSAHKFYSLKGCGFLYAKTGRSLEPLIHGGAQERGRRAGTENALAIAAMGVMAEKVSEIEHRAGVMKAQRDCLEQALESAISGLVVTGKGSKRLANTLSVIIPGVDGESLLMNLDIKGFAVSTGAACSSGSPEPSPVLLAMGLSRAEAQSSLRISLGWSTTEAQLHQFVKALTEVVERLRAFTFKEQRPSV